MLALHASPLKLSHAWIVVKEGAAERTAFERAGFQIDPNVNHHEGQGTSSITVEFENGFLELMYPDANVSVTNAVAAEKFRLKSQWRESGYSPIGLVFDRTASTPTAFPFATWKVTSDWLEKGTFIEMLTPRDMPKALSLSIASHTSDTRAFHHPNGTKRLTSVHVIAPSADQLPPAASYIAEHGQAKFDVAKDWLLEVTLDEGRRGITKDLRPDLPMLIHY